jgi:glycosyltransferase involved in cell wall biosynthesis
VKLLFLSHEYPPFPTGGVGSYTASMTRALAARGHEVHVLSCLAGQAPSDQRDGQVHVHRRGLTRRPFGLLSQRIITALSCRREIDRLGTQFDVIESPDHMAEGLFMLERRRTPVVGYAHDSERLCRRTRPCDLPERAVLQRAALVRSPSELLARHLIDAGWVRPDRMHVVAPPIELDAWSPTDAAATRPVVLVVGRVDEIKSPEVAVRAAAILRRDVPDLVVRVIGKSLGTRDGLDYVDWLRRLADALRVECDILPEVDRSGLAPRYAEARVVAIPSRVENLPMVALEAMACGRAVVATARSGLANLLDGTGAGALVAVDDPPTLAAALLPYLADPQAAAAAGRRARAEVANQHDPGRAAAAVEALYDGLARETTA